MTSTAPSSQARHAIRRAGGALGATVLALALVGTAGAKQSDRSQPVEVSAHAADASAQPNGTSHLKGDVVITQGTLKATGANATIHFDAQSQVKRVVLTGAPAHLQQVDDNGNLMRGRANKIDYDVPQGVAILTGDAHVDQPGRGSASGDKLVYDTQTSTMTAESHGDNRVHLTFKPRQEPSASGTPPTPATAATTPAPATSAAPANANTVATPASQDGH